MVNLIVISIILIFGFIISNRGHRYSNLPSTRRNYIFFVSTLLILQSGLRNVAVGADTYAYKWIFDQSKLYQWSEILSFFTDYSTKGMARDPGYLVFQKIIFFLVGDNYQILLFAIAIIFFTALGQFIFRNTLQFENIIFAFVIYSVLFYAFFSITGHRQTLAVALLLWGYEYFKNKKYLAFILFNLAAFTLHKSSLVFLLLLPLSLISSSKKILIISLLSLPFLLLIKLEFFKFLQLILGYEEYLEYEGAGTLIFTTLLVLVSILSIVFSDLIQRRTPFAHYLYRMLALSVFFVPLTWINPSAMRIVLYFSIYLVILIPLIVDSISIKIPNMKKILYSFAILVLLLLYLRASWNSEYKFFWQIMEIPEHYYY